MGERLVAAVCGRDPTGTFPDGRMGCGKPIDTCAEVFRCTDCTVPFHRDCAKHHFKKSNENLMGKLVTQGSQLVTTKRELEAAKALLKTAGEALEAIVHVDIRTEYPTTQGHIAEQAIAKIRSQDGGGNG